MKSLHGVTFWLLVIGGINWLLAVWNVDIASWGLNMTIVNIIYILVGLSALYEAITHGKRCKECRGEMMQNSNMPKM